MLRKGSQQLSQWSKKAIQVTKGALNEKSLAACAGTYAHVSAETIQNFYSKMEQSSQKTSNVNKILLNEINRSSTAILKNGYYKVNGFKFSSYYYKKLWNEGRGAPSLVAKEIIKNATDILPDKIKLNFLRYRYKSWEMVYNPRTKEVWHLQPVKMDIL